MPTPASARSTPPPCRRSTVSGSSSATRIRRWPGLDPPAGRRSMPGGNWWSRLWPPSRSRTRTDSSKGDVLRHWPCERDCSEALVDVRELNRAPGHLPGNLTWRIKTRWHQPHTDLRIVMFQRLHNRPHRGGCRRRRRVRLRPVDSSIRRRHAQRGGHRRHSDALDERGGVRGRRATEVRPVGRRPWAAHEPTAHS